MAIYKIKLHLQLDEPTGYYTETSPDVPGLVTVGADMAEIMHNVQDALDCLIEGLRALGKELPPVRAIIRQLGMDRQDFGSLK